MRFTHFNENGFAKMINVSQKDDTFRTAVAIASIKMKKETISLLKDGLIKKGDVLAVSQVAGIMGAKKTCDLIPMCHNILINGADIDFEILSDSVQIKANLSTTGKTGIEMEALMSVSIAAMTIYDMCKSVDKDMVIGDIRLVKKTGGKSGEYVKVGELDEK